MAIPIESFQDILDVLERNPEYREAMRRHILDEEIQRLPAEFRQLRETVDNLAQLVRDYMETTDERLGRLESDVAELKEGQARLETDVLDLKAGQARLETDVLDLKAGQARLETDVLDLKVGQARLETDVLDLKVGQARLEGRIGDVAGTAYERRIVKHCRSIAGRHLGIKRAKILHSINVAEHETLDDLIYTASEAGSITDEQAYDLDLADIIISGSGAPGQADYAVIEVSETIGDSDVDRACERAAILASVVIKPVAAAVIGKAVSDANRERAARSSVAVILMAD